MIFPPGKDALQLFPFFFIQAGHENGLILGQHPAGDGLNLGNGFAGPVNNFGRSESVGAVQIHLGEGAGKVGEMAAKFRHGNFRRERIAVEAGARRWRGAPASWSHDVAG